MGQKRDVDVFRLISQGTLEENIYERQMQKSSAMRIAYTASEEARPIIGREGDGELWGVKNMFVYHPEGTSLRRVCVLGSILAFLSISHAENSNC